MTTIPFRELLSGAEPAKFLTKGYKRHVGRGASGRISVRHKGGGVKRRYRLVDFSYNKKNILATILSVEYDPNRTGFIGLVAYRDGERRYVLLPKSLRNGDTFMVAEDAPVKPGNRLPIGKIPVGTFVYNVEIRPAGGAKLVRSAGSFAEVLAHEGGYTHLRLPSTEVRKVIDGAWASVGEVSNEENRLIVIGKAGRSRWLGIRPTVRGSAMNPVDHPYGGGEGRQGRGRRRLITWTGRPVGKGQKSRRRKKYSNVFILSRRKVGKRGAEVK
ncbi:MAG: 50S ribosomal protein L2, plastid [Parcubacteria group bacterium Gr01-1014_72]|nr:MAG: 50S ribosomal protein L2, plastid [Parcubacteria group bacterium Gr01-1014_72]